MNEAALFCERDRLEALDRYDILDTPREQAFDRITRLVRRIFGVPIATVAFLDAHRQWFKSELGMGASETPREPAFCDHAIRQRHPLIVPDARLDPRFADNVFVTGEPHLRFYAGIPLRSPDGHNVGTLCAMDTRPRQFDAEQVSLLEDLAHLVVDQLELRHLARTDSLTGALSRRGFREQADRSVSLALRHGHDLACLALDLDHFKAVNDTYGHEQGDTVLAATVALCRDELRKTDLIGRVGGEEFAILLPLASRTAAFEVAEKLRGAIGAQRFKAGRETFSVTASLGVASLDRSMGSIDDLLKRADGVLYAAKAAGRNRSITWQPAEPEKATVRRRVLKAGRISFNGQRSSLDCTVKSLSDDGAGLDVFTSSGVPKIFELVIEADKFVRPCHVVEQTDRHLEVAFD